MRLTLRNLLAYMDDLLDPESARIIGQKTEESEFASKLLHRIRDVSRRSKLGAPEVIDQKAALDPNTVAEYLDNTLPTDRVTDFEKVCLDSDVELAEVAACHQVLTLVLGEPAEVRPESRVRMYQLPQTAASHTYVESEPPEVGSTEHRRVDTPEPPPVKDRHPAVPEYLLSAQRRRRRLYAMAITAAAVCVVAYFWATGGLRGFLGGGEEPPLPDDQVAVVPAQPDLQIESAKLPDAPLPSSIDFPDPSLVVPSSEPAPETPVVDSVPTEPSVEPTETTPGTMAEAQPAPETVIPVTPTPVSPAPVSPPVASESPATMVPESTADSGSTPPVATPDPGQVAAASVPAATPNLNPEGTEPMVIEPVVAEPTAPQVPAEGRDIAQLFTPEEMALVTDGTGQSFTRVANSVPLKTGQRVVSLPTSRPVLLVGGKLHVEMVDGGEMVLLPSDVDGPVSIEVVCGRMVLAPADEAGPVTASLRVGDVVGTVTLSDSTSLAALEVGRADGPIADPLTQPAQVTARLWGVSGNVSWTPVGGAEIPAKAIDLIDLDGSVASGVPEWVQADLASKLARQASGILNRALVVGEDDVDVTLHENAIHRRREVRELARRCLSWIGDFEPVVEVLDDSERYSEWPGLIDLLRESVRRGPRTAQAVQSAMVAEYGNRGNELYELLWKYDADQLPADAAKKLVTYLDDESLPYRVLSFNNLNRITKLGFYYRPEKSSLERGPSIRRWIRWAEDQPGAAPPKPTDAPPTAELPK